MKVSSSFCIFIKSSSAQTNFFCSKYLKFDVLRSGAVCLCNLEKIPECMHFDAYAQDIPSVFKTNVNSSCCPALFYTGFKDF